MGEVACRRTLLLSRLVTASLPFGLSRHRCSASSPFWAQPALLLVLYHCVRCSGISRRNGFDGQWRQQSATAKCSQARSQAWGFMRAVALYTLFVQGCAEQEQCKELAQLAMISSTSIIASLISFTGVAAELSHCLCVASCQQLRVLFRSKVLVFQHWVPRFWRLQMDARWHFWPQNDLRKMPTKP